MYKMLTLLRLGASSDYANQLDSQIDDLVRPDGKQNPELPQSMIDEDETWAQETHSKYFSVSPRLKETPFPCGSSTPGPELVLGCKFTQSTEPVGGWGSCVRPPPLWDPG